MTRSMPGTSASDREAVGEAEEPEARRRRRRRRPACRARVGRWRPRARRRSAASRRVELARRRRASRPSAGRRSRRRRARPSSGFVTSHAIRRRHLASRGSSPSRSTVGQVVRRPRAERPKDARRRRRSSRCRRCRARCRGCRRRGPRAGRRPSRGSSRPTAIALSRPRAATARTPSPSRRTPRRRRRARASGPDRPARAGRAPRASRHAQPPAASIATSVPSPPSASGASSDLVVGPGARASRPRAPGRPRRCVSEPLNESGRDQDATSTVPLTRLPSGRRLGVTARREPAVARGTRGCGSSAAAPWSASSMTSSESRPAAGARQLHRRAQLREQPRPRRSSSRFITAWRITNDIRDRPSSSWLRWTRRSRSTWPSPSMPGPLGDVDQVADLDRIAGEERDLLEQRAPARRTRPRAAG